MQTQTSNLWKIYFVILGIMSLICWNMILNMIFYFSLKINDEVYITYQFAFCFSGILSFLFSPKIFKNYSAKTQIRFSLLIMAICFYSCFIICETSISKEYKVIFSVGLVAISGFFSSCF